jgi:hypothetical protein
VNYIIAGEPVVNTVSALILACSFIFISTTIFRTHQRDLRHGVQQTGLHVAGRSAYSRFFLLACIWAALMCVQVIHMWPGAQPIVTHFVSSSSSSQQETASDWWAVDAVHIGTQALVESYGTFLEIGFGTFVVMSDLGVTTIQLTFWIALAATILCATIMVATDVVCITANVRSGGGDEVFIPFAANATAFAPKLNELTRLMCYGWSGAQFKKEDPMQNLAEISTYAFFAVVRVPLYLALYAFCILSNNPQLFTNSCCGCIDVGTEQMMTQAGAIGGGSAMQGERGRGARHESRSTSRSTVGNTPTSSGRSWRAPRSRQSSSSRPARWRRSPQPISKSLSSTLSIVDRSEHSLAHGPFGAEFGANGVLEEEPPIASLCERADALCCVARARCDGRCARCTLPSECSPCWCEDEGCCTPTVCRATWRRTLGCCVIVRRREPQSESARFAASGACCAFSACVCVCAGKARSKAPLRWCLYLIAINALRAFGYGAQVILGRDWGICVGVVADTIHFALFVPLIVWLAEVDAIFISSAVTRALTEWGGGGGGVGGRGAAPGWANGLGRGLLEEGGALLEEFARADQQSIAAKLAEIKDCEIPYSQLQFEREIDSSGGTATVSLYWWRGSKVAVKMLRQQIIDGEQIALALKEINLMRQIGKHTNIIEFKGLTIHPPNIGIIMEFCERGSLFDVLESE